MQSDAGRYLPIQIKETILRSGRAYVELKLPDRQECIGDEAVYVLYLWDAKGALVFYTCRPVQEEEPCVIQLVHPHLWEGGENPYLYRLELYIKNTLEKVSGTTGGSLRLLKRCWLPVRCLQIIPKRGWFLNNLSFRPACVLVDLFGASCDGKEYLSFWEKRLQSLAIMGANVIVPDALTELSDQERGFLQECCDRQGLLLLENRELALQENDTIVNDRLLYDSLMFPTDLYYRYKACWSKEAFVYISSAGIIRQPEGGYRVHVYSNRKKVVLLINGVVFGFQEDGPEFIFQDMQIKSFPVCLTAEGEDCHMSMVCYR